MANSHSKLLGIQTPPLFNVGFNLLEEMFQFTDVTPEMLPSGVQITITGQPGTGKTRLALQLLDAIGKNNPDLKTEHRSYEMSGAMLKDLVLKLRIDNIDTYSYDQDLETFAPFVPGTLYLIDSLDFWASNEGERYPSDRMAKLLLDAKQQHITVILVHHKTKNRSGETGSVLFRQYNDIRIEVKQTKQNNHIQVSSHEKNRYPGQKRDVTLKHSPFGLVPVPPSQFETIWMGLLNRIDAIAQNL